jgi:hypothetical protein
MTEYVLSVKKNIGDEFHYLFICKHELIAALRSKFIPKYYTSKGLLSYMYKYKEKHDKINMGLQL